MREIDTIVFHCSASDNPNQDVGTMRQYHVFTKGWADIGYHYFIKKDGTIQEGRPIDKIGAHVARHNTGTVGVCFAGLNDFTKPQMEAAHEIIKIINKKVGKELALKGHNDYTKKKTCPNFDIPKFLKGELKIIRRF